MQPLVLFGGLFRVPMFGYYWVHTSAQIDLLAIDVPVVVYKKDKKDVKHSKKEMDSLMAKWEAKRKAQGKSSDFKSGEKANLNDFLRTGMDAFKNTK
jgi:hypothetical protein